MPIRHKKSDVFRDQIAGGAVPDAARTNGRTLNIIGTASNAADDSNGSSFHLGDIPSGAILHENTFFDVQNTGFAAIRIGTKTDVDALVSVLKSAGNEVLPVARGDANHGKPLWQHLGLAEDPGGFIGIYQHAIADATGAGSMPYRLTFVV